MQLKVFYVDDEPELCEIFLEEFSSNEINVFAFTDPPKAIEEARLKSPDVIFLDYRFPGTNGDIIAQAMLPHIPKYLITGDQRVSPAYPFEAVLNKPFNRGVIREILTLHAQKACVRR